MNDESAARQRRFTKTTLWISASLLTWIGSFGLIYVFAALACASGFYNLQWLGIGIVPLMAVIVCVMAAAATVVLMRRALTSSSAQQDESSRFIHFVAFATALLALIGLLYLALPPVLFAQHCSAGA